MTTIAVLITIAYLILIGYLIVGFDKIKLNENKTISKKHEETFIDFNAIAQGYSVDVVVNYLKSKGIENAIVEIGGELFALGKNTIENKNWVVWEKKPNNNGLTILNWLSILYFSFHFLWGMNYYRIPLDEKLRLSANELEKAIIKDKENGLMPFFINASFGTTNTGAVDPIESIAHIAIKHKLWFHVDAAYGGFFKLVTKLNSKFEGIQQADSITLDPHKTLFLPFGTGTILIKNKEKSLKDLAKIDFENYENQNDLLAFTKE